jgi:hypothetical protein
MVDLFGVDKLAHVHDDPGKDPEPPGIEERSPSIVDDQILICLDPFLQPGLIATQPAKLVVRGIIDDLCGHGTSDKEI